MARHHVPHLVGKKNADGSRRWYWQPSATLAAAGWTTLPLGRQTGAAIELAEARNAEVDRWRQGGACPAEVAPKPAAGSVAELVALYRRKVLAKTGPGQLSRKTVENYTTPLARIEAWAASHRLAWITRRRVRELRDASLAEIGHAPAYVLLKMLRTLMAFAEEEELIAKGSNPAADFGLPAPPPRSAVWEADDEAAFIDAAHDLGLPSMAFAIELAIYSGQREADLIAFAESQWQPIELRDPEVRAIFAGNGEVMGWKFAQGKTSTDYVRVEMAIPFEPALRARVTMAMADNAGHVLIDDRTGRPWKKRAFIACWRKITDHAALRAGRPAMRELVWHDLRRTRVVRLRRRGMDPALIATITGHSPQSIRQMLRIYGPVDPTMTAAAIALALAA